jgi:hypothetical protein
MYKEELSYTQQEDLVERLQEALSEDLEGLYPGDTVGEVVDSWVPVYHTDIRESWVAAGCPDPDEYMPDNNEYAQMSIHNLMSLGLAELANNFASSCIWSEEVGETNNHGEALQAIRANYPEFTTGA